MPDYPYINIYRFGAWLSPVERSVRDREVGSSNLLAPTIKGSSSNFLFLFLLLHPAPFNVASKLQRLRLLYSRAF
jgi:hypothetical protein